MKIMKKNQMIILIISLILIVAGYLNFTSGNKDNYKKIAELGDATLVSSNSISEENNIVNESTLENTNTITNEVVATAKEEDNYFTTSKLERENMYSQMLETYQQIYNNSEATAEQKTNALNEISNINKIKNGIMISENLISAKGFEKVIIFVNSNSISVIIGKEEILPEEIAQIQNIVSRELNVTADIIHISKK